MVSYRYVIREVLLCDVTSVPSAVPVHNIICRYKGVSPQHDSTKKGKHAADKVNSIRTHTFVHVFSFRMNNNRNGRQNLLYKTLYKNL